MKRSKVLGVRMPIVEIEELQRRAADAGLPVGTYARSIMHRERVDSAAAIAILHALVQAQHAEVVGQVERVRSENEATRDALSQLVGRFDKLLAKLNELVQVVNELVQSGEKK